MSTFDKGPNSTLADHFARLPAVPEQFRQHFWYDWGPVFYRGRLTRDAKVIGIASDPGPTERLAGRNLVGDAGQRVQGFLAKIGLNSSYVLVNAFPIAVHPTQMDNATPLLSDPAQRAWRNTFYDLIVGDKLQAIVAFGVPASKTLPLWTGKPDVPHFVVPHPSSRDESKLLTKWRVAVDELRTIVTPDPDGNATGANYGVKFEETDYRRIPSEDLPFGLPPWVGDDSWGRRATPRHRNSVRRSDDDPDHTLIWQAPAAADLE